MSAESVREMRRMMDRFDAVVEARKRYSGVSQSERAHRARPPLVVLDATENRP